MFLAQFTVSFRAGNGRMSLARLLAKPHGFSRKDRANRAATLLVFSLLGLLASTAAHATPPHLYRTPGYGAPVRGGPGDLLFLPGYELSDKDVVVYAAIEGELTDVTRPKDVPTVSGPTVGTAELISTDNVPNSLTIKLPEQMRADQTYALWVRNSEGRWSDPAFINDARPLWISPPYVLETGSVAGLPRTIRVIGRNLSGGPDSITKVRLAGPQTAALDATLSLASTAEFVAEAALPPKLAPGKYQVSVSRDGEHWVEVPDQKLEVRTGRGGVATFPLDDPQFGNCKADDERDDTPCLSAVLKAAAAAGGGKVQLARGVWRLTNPAGLSGDGLVVGKGVSLAGADGTTTTLQRGANWSPQDGPERPSFTLLGNNVVSGIRFGDDRRYTANDRPAPVLRLGYFRGESPRGVAPNTGLVENVVISHNVFDRSNVAIADSGAPIRGLIIANNAFGSFKSSLNLEGNRFQVHQVFRLEDSVIRNNLFKPGSYLDSSIRQGTIAAEFGAARRVDFSGNKADGADKEFLYSPTDAPGWRAAFFWHLNNNQEMVLVSDNTATCTGDKAGDGEAFAFDNNGNTFAQDAARVVLAASRNTVTVDGPLIASQSSRAVDASRYYVGHWMFVGDGPGVGQARRISSYDVDAASDAVTFTVSPPWDVTPEANSSRVDVGRTFWQLYVVGNTVDHRTPLCRKGNASDVKGGGITLWARAADSAIARNTQMDTDGIMLHPYTAERGTECANCEYASFAVYSSEIRDNLINGEYDANNDCSPSGIALTIGTTVGTVPPLLMAYGLSIAHNKISRADAEGGGSIAMSYSGPPKLASPLVSSTLIFKNTIVETRGKPLQGCRRPGAARATAIQMGSARAAQKSVLSQNMCPGAKRRLTAEPLWGKVVCGAAASSQCGCRH